MEKTKEKTCVFFASDYHFEMITLPFIEKNLRNNKKIIVLTENDLEDTIKNLISKVNLKEEKKEKIFKIDWKNNDLKKFKEIKKEVENKEDLIIFIKGKENYIKNVNENIAKWTNKTDTVKIIDCYDVEEIREHFADVVNYYENVLSTTGERKIRQLKS